MDLSVRKLLRPGQTRWLSFALEVNHEQYKTFMMIYGKVVSHGNLPKVQDLEVCQNIQTFIRFSLINLKLLLPFDDIMIQKIGTFDPNCNASLEELPQLAQNIQNLIPEEGYPLFYNEVKEWALEEGQNHCKQDKGFNPETFFLTKSIEEDYQ